MRCPTCGKRIRELNKSYACDCLNIPKVILQQRITKDIIQELMVSGRTKILDGFISNKTGKRFSAALVIRDKKVDFEFTGKSNMVNIRVHSGNSGTAHVTIKGAMYKEFKISYGHVSSRMAECLACITAANLVKHNMKGAKLDISLNNLDFSRYILRERTPRDKEIKSALEHLFVLLGCFNEWRARYAPKKRPELTGSPQSKGYPRGVFPDLDAAISEENGRLRVVLSGGPDVQTQFTASLKKAEPDGEKTYSLPATARNALMAWIYSVRKEGGSHGANHNHRQ